MQVSMIISDWLITHISGNYNASKLICSDIDVVEYVYKQLIF